MLRYRDSSVENGVLRSSKYHRSRVNVNLLGGSRINMLPYFQWINTIGTILIKVINIVGNSATHSYHKQHLKLY